MPPHHLPRDGLSLRISGGGEAGPHGPAARVPVGGAAGKAGHGSCGPVFGEPCLELALPRPFESAGLSVPCWGPRRLLSERGQACVAPGLHQGGILAAETALSEVKTAPVHLRVPVGSRRPASSLLHPLCSRGRWEGAGCVPWEMVLVPLRSLAPRSWLCSSVLQSGGAMRKLQC